MGLLDDAIREHLDLKRRRGADPAEVERAEQEALGPVRRNRDPGDVADQQDQVSETGGFAYDQDDDQEWHEAAPAGAGLADPDFEDDVPDVDPVLPPDPAERSSVRPRSLREPVDDEVPAPRDEAQTSFDEPEAGFDEPRASTREPAAGQVDTGRDWSAADDEAFADEPFATTPGSPRRPADVAGQETTEYHIEDALDDEDEAEAEDADDMLEETPDFLQDTPDHDRLWFEQRPPRDFDFDG
jgi:hypothetical protein